MAKSKPTLNLASHAATSSSTLQSPIASKSLGILRAPCQLDWKSTGRLVAREHNQDAASSSQVWQKDAILDESTRRLAAVEKNQELLNFHEKLKSTRKLRHRRYWQNFCHTICRSIMHYTSYLRTKDCTNNGYVMDMLEHNTMINIDTGVHMISYITQT